MTVREILEGTLALIEPASHHTTKVLARDRDGKSVAPTSPYACRWCVIGGLLKVAGRDRLSHAGPDAQALGLLDQQMNGHLSVSRRNDIEGHCGAVSMLKRAIASLDGSTA